MKLAESVANYLSLLAKNVKEFGRYADSVDTNTSQGIDMFGLFSRTNTKSQNVIDDESCRRDLSDRRQDHKRALYYSLFKRRRRGPRRDADSQTAQYVDVHEPAVVAVVFGVILLSTLDAFLTLNIISRGGEEVNPFMKVLLDYDVTTFFLAKFAITAVGLIFTIVHKHFRIFKTISGYHILYAVFFGYGCLIWWELYLLDFLPTLFGQ